MSKHRILPEAGYVNPSKLEKGENGRALCRKCKKEVPKGRKSFCSEDCIHEWKIRTQPGYAREFVFKRDGGICAMCRTNTEGVRGELISLKWEIVQERFPGLMAVSHTPPGTYVDDPRWIQACQKYRLKPNLDLSRSPWAMDHILPVAEGGGECGLENLRTLCHPCHNDVTQQLRKRLREAKKKGSNL